MIGRLVGVVVERYPTRVVLDVGGVGYELAIPVPTFEQLPEVGGEAQLIVHTHVREAALDLYGFSSAAERQLFRHLLAVSGVGPKLALALLSGMTVEQFRQAIQGGDVGRLTQVPGVGKRTAERLVVELGNRLGLDRTPGRAAPTPASPAFADAVAALTALGFSASQAGQATRSAAERLGEQATVEALVKESLAAATKR